MENNISKKHIIVALDISDFAKAMNFAKTVAEYVYGFKIGLEFFFAHGLKGVNAISNLNKPLFLDLKLHDIPNTVLKAVQALSRDIKFDMITIHISGGISMLNTLSEMEKPYDFKLIGVSFLTSLNDDDITKLGFQGTLEDNIVNFFNIANDCNLDGVVCSSHEIVLANQVNSKFLTVVPGIRPSLNDVVHQDQKRIATPSFAISQGASFLIIGRPLYQSENPLNILQNMFPE